jgi:Flp pilus assembly pilin Flp
MSNLRTVISRFVFDDEGQDLVEYALLTALVGIVGVAVFGIMRNNMAQSYDNWTNAGTPGSIQYNWEPPPPGS